MAGFLVRVAYPLGRWSKRGLCWLLATAWRRLRTWYAPLGWEFKAGVLAAAVGMTLIASAYVYAQFLAFLSPASGDTQRAAYFGGVGQSYCTYWATDHAQVGKPTASPCGVMMISVALSPSDSMPYAGDKYASGNCTYWAAMRRGQIGKPIPNTWGDAYLWASRARLDSYSVDHIPTAGAIMQSSGGALGHVAFVESVDGDGTWHISEMNVVGLGIVDYRAMPASAASSYFFIH